MDGKSQGLRSGQQRRTRAALLKATVELLRAGRSPSVAEAAEAADVSRRTAYRYFPTQEQLLTEAALETLRPRIQAALPPSDAPPATRLAAAVRAMQEQACANETLLRTMIRLTVERGGREQGGVEPAARGSRRIEWIEDALAPVRNQLTKTAFARLVAGVALCVGAEALIVLRDIRGLDQAEAIDVSVWSANALLKAALDEATASGGRTSKAR